MSFQSAHAQNYVKYAQVVNSEYEFSVCACSKLYEICVDCKLKYEFLIFPGAQIMRHDDIFDSEGRVKVLGYFYF